MCFFLSPFFPDRMTWTNKRFLLREDPVKCVGATNLAVSGENAISLMPGKDFSLAGQFQKFQTSKPPRKTVQTEKSLWKNKHSPWKNLKTNCWQQKMWKCFSMLFTSGVCSLGYICVSVWSWRCVCVCVRVENFWTSATSQSCVKRSLSRWWEIPTGEDHHN